MFCIICEGNIYVICGSSENDKLISEGKLNFFLNGRKENETKIFGISL